MFTWLSSRENVTFLIAIIGFAISIYNFIAGITQNRIRVSIEIADIFRAENGHRCIDIIHVKIINTSKNPITLSRVTLSNHLGSFSFGNHRREVFSTTLRSGTEITRQRVWFSDYLPVRVEGNGFVNLLLVADKEAFAASKTGPNRFKFFTDKKTITKEVHISNFTDYRKIEECREPDWQSQKEL